MGLKSANSFAGQAVVKAQPSAEPQRATELTRVKIDYEWRGKGYIFAARVTSLVRTARLLAKL